MKLIVFTGSMGSGKSTCVELLKENNYVYLHKFAQPLYDMQEFIYRRVCTVYERPEKFQKDRKLLQWLGTEWGRNTISPTIWIDLWKEHLAGIKFTLQTDNDIVICDDCRFDNEAEAVIEMCGVIIQVKSTRNIERINTANGINNHESEKGIDPKYIYATINNDGSIDDLKTSLFKIIDELK